MRNKIPLIELKSLRNSFGNDTSAILKHSVRYYRHGNTIYLLDKVLDVLPVSFTLSVVQCRDNKPISGSVDRLVKIDGNPDWGKELSWADAERKIMLHVDAVGISRDNGDTDLFVQAKLNGNFAT